MIVFKTVNTTKLNKEIITSICQIKDEYWSFGLKSQLKYFKKNIKSFDIHNLMYKNSELVGYTVFRVRKIFLKKKLKKYLLLDSIIIKKKFRKKNLEKLLMEYNNKMIKSKKMISILFCKTIKERFFKKYSWKSLKKNNYNVLDHELPEKVMYFNKLGFKFDKLNLLKISVKSQKYLPGIREINPTQKKNNYFVSAPYGELFRKNRGDIK